jgi:hypothetical protein
MDAVSASVRIGRERDVRSLVVACVAYWTGLVGWALWTPASVFLRLRQQMPGRTSLLFNDELQVKVLVDHHPVWVAGVSSFELMAWVAGPPLLIWVCWLLRTGRARTIAPDAHASTPEIGAGDASGWPSQQRSPTEQAEPVVPERSRRLRWWTRRDG